jgi:hypothetical protein
MGGLFPKPVPEVMTMSLLLAATLSAVLLTQISWAAAVEEVAMLKSSDRQKILVEGAKKEGKLSFYTTLIVDQVVRPLKEAFRSSSFAATPIALCRDLYRSIRPRDMRWTSSTGPRPRL